MLLLAALHRLRILPTATLNTCLNASNSCMQLLHTPRLLTVIMFASATRPAPHMDDCCPICIAILRLQKGLWFEQNNFLGGFGENATRNLQLLRVSPDKRIIAACLIHQPHLVRTGPGECTLKWTPPASLALLQGGKLRGHDHVHSLPNA